MGRETFNKFEAEDFIRESLDKFKDDRAAATHLLANRYMLGENESFTSSLNKASKRVRKYVDNVERKLELDRCLEWIAGMKPTVDNFRKIFNFCEKDRRLVKDFAMAISDWPDEVCTVDDETLEDAISNAGYGSVRTELALLREVCIRRGWLSPFSTYSPCSLVRVLRNYWIKRVSAIRINDLKIMHWKMIFQEQKDGLLFGKAPKLKIFEIRNARIPGKYLMPLLEKSIDLKTLEELDISSNPIGKADQLKILQGEIFNNLRRLEMLDMKSFAVVIHFLHQAESEKLEILGINRLRHSKGFSCYENFFKHCIEAYPNLKTLILSQSEEPYVNDARQYVPEGLEIIFEEE